jgi:ribose transport system substrate-binding protein
MTKHLPTRVQSVRRACDLLKAFGNASDILQLNELATRAGLNKTTACHLLATLVDCGLVTRMEGSGYRRVVQLNAEPRFRVAFALQSYEFAFSRAVASSVERRARAMQIDLITLDNEDNPKKALRNAARLVEERVDLVIESQTDVRVAAQISKLFRDARIPVIAVEIPHPHTVYYGANNSRAGLIAGRHLAQWAANNWGGRVDELLLLELPKAGHVPNARILGSLLGVIERVVGLANRQVRVIRTNGHMSVAHERVRAYLQKTKAKRILVSAINDPCALGALQAFREAGREMHCAVVGQNASQEVHSELRNPQSRLIGSVAYFPERYGDGIIPLALEILAGRRVPQATFVKHQLITHANLEAIYPSVGINSHRVE